MQISQAGTLAIVGNVVNQLLVSKTRLDFALVYEQVCLNVLLAAPTVVWLRTLTRWQLHWVTGTLADQLGFNVAANVALFFFRAATFKGGVRLLWVDGSGLRLSLHWDAFPSLRVYEPIWSTRAKGLKLKLPTTLLREKLVPPHLKGVFEVCMVDALTAKRPWPCMRPERAARLTMPRAVARSLCLECHYRCPLLLFLKGMVSNAM